jgi:hypothetical protein
MPNDPYKNPFESWHWQRCHPNAPAGGGGPGNFTSAGPLGSGDQGRDSLPHPNSPVGRYLTHQDIRTPTLPERVEYVVKAYFQALRLAPGAVYQETGYQLGQVIEALLPGLLQMLAVLGISVVAGAAVGAAIGLFLGGVSAAPGAVVGAELGLEIGTAVLAWMGLGFLAVAIGQGMGELTGVLMHAIRRAWHAAERHHPQFETDRAAEGLAQAVGILFRLILQGLLAYVLKKGTVSTSQAALSTAQTLSRGGAGAAADASLAEISALLRKSKLPDGFVVWLERNWDDLKRNPKLTSNKASPAVSSQASAPAATPSELKAMKEKQGRKDVGKNPDNENNAIPKRTTDKKATLDERPTYNNIAHRLDELKLQGHGPQRHGGDVTHQQLIDRAVHGKDPVTNTIYDAYRKNPDGTPARHLVGPNATRFKSNEAFVNAEAYIRNSTDFDSALATATNGRFQVDIPAKQVLGANYLDHLEGVTRLGSKNNPIGWQPTDFTDATIRARYHIDASGQIKLTTMYPEPR